jgi:hypothetical protein
MKKEKNKFYASLFLGYGYTFLVIFGLSVLAIVIFVIPTPFENEKLGVQIEIIFMLGILPIVFWLGLIHRGFTLIEINEEGIKTSLFYFFRRKQLTWDEVTDTKVVYNHGVWLFVSTIDLKGLPYRKLVSNKNIIVIQLDNHVLSLYNKYAKKKIE